MRFHALKTWPEPFRAVKDGIKSFEYRRDDRNFQVGDVVVLREWDPESGKFTKERAIAARIIYLTRMPALGIPAGYCVMALSDWWIVPPEADLDHIEMQSPEARYQQMRGAR